MKKIIITGGAGFIGSHLIEKLLNRGVEDILVIDDLSTGKNSNIDKFSESNKITFINKKVEDVDNLSELFMRVRFLLPPCSRSWCSVHHGKSKSISTN